MEDQQSGFALWPKGIDASTPVEEAIGACSHIAMNPSIARVKVGEAVPIYEGMAEWLDDDGTATERTQIEMVLRPEPQLTYSIAKTNRNPDNTKHPKVFVPDMTSLLT